MTIQFLVRVSRFAAESGGRLRKHIEYIHPVKLDAERMDAKALRKRVENVQAEVQQAYGPTALVSVHPEDVEFGF